MRVKGTPPKNTHPQKKERDEQEKNDGETADDRGVEAVKQTKQHEWSFKKKARRHLSPCETLQ